MEEKNFDWCVPGVKVAVVTSVLGGDRAVLRTVDRVTTKFIIVAGCKFRKIDGNGVGERSAWQFPDRLRRPDDPSVVRMLLQQRIFDLDKALSDLLYAARFNVEILEDFKEILARAEALIAKEQDKS